MKGDYRGYCKSKKCADKGGNYTVQEFEVIKYINTPANQGCYRGANSDYRKVKCLNCGETHTADFARD